VNYKLFFDTVGGWVRFLIPQSFAQSVILPRPPADSPLMPRLHQRIRERLAPFKGEKVEAWVEVGHIELTRGDFEQLDPGDIILLEGSEVRLEGGEISGPAAMKIGLGRRGVLRGMVGSQDGQHVFQIDELALEPIPEVHDPIEGHGEFENPEQVVAEYEDAPVEDQADDGAATEDEIRDEDFGIDDEDDTGDDEDYQEGEEEQGGYADEGRDGGGGEEAVDDNLAEAEPLLGDIPMVLVVELGRVQLTADEVIRLRAGQLIELGRAPTDPVDLVVNGKLIAKGELVEIEGALGVKILNLVKGVQ
jgi:flagellar motor switch protein FliM